MDSYAEKLQMAIATEKIDCVQCFYEEDVSNSESCRHVLGVSLTGIIKTIIMLNEERKAFAFVLRGDCRIDRKLLKKELHSKDFRLATPEQILEITGYPLGGVPPFGYTAEFIIDGRLLEEQNTKFYAGGGSTNTLIKITPLEIIKVTKAKVSSFSKPFS